jgi:CBS domain-containing protein
VKLYDSVALILRHKGSAVYAIGPDATVYEALEKLAQWDIGALVVMDGTELVGILSERDYVRKVIIKGRSSKEMLVREIMSSPVLAVDPKTTVDDCMRSMTNERCRHLVVLDDGKVVGVVSIGDLVNWIITAQDVTIHQLEDYITGRYPA